MERKDDNRNCYMLRGLLAWKGYDWWWHSFTGTNASTGEERQFFIEYYIMNPKRGGEQPEFGLDGKKKPAYVMIKAGEWGGKGKQLHRFFGTKELECDTDELRVVVGDCFLSETVLKGNVTVSEETACSHPEYMSDAGSMSWLLQVDKKTEYQVGYGASALFRKLNAFQMYWHAAGMRTEYNGTVFFDGERYSISSSTSYGYADKNWGTDFTNPWIWLAGCSITSRLTNEPLNDTSFDFGGGCPKIFGFPRKENLLGKIRYK
jgi:tocopherol cyclase